ncbi:hypothetical protein COT48_03260 [Candidatus Woesearchaeota archaeon CG08_land_8_20_14_0_20_47_9]|nr:MAG: hypothetical protein COV22_02430 [Candidatus Woesearchaeota archaeon CG10_big_fil_rev_8_21_14_0_10_47_5]PIO03889.1 MAG: hypothetical protein COT48_03260 [Candidatus Woesearchaeota archaeon CG08_land_8_20_14_0_20_47_9]
MITKNELKKYCTITGFNLGQVGMDYLQHLFFIFLSRNSVNNLIFKGGTALQKAFGLNRFSIDIDFTQVRENGFGELIKKIGKNISDYGYPTQVEEIKTIGKTFLIKIKGPLYSGVPMSVYKLKIE